MESLALLSTPTHQINHVGMPDECPGQEKEYIVQTDGGVYGPDWDTAQFISHARADIPWLLYQLGEMRHKWNDVLKHEDVALANCRRLESELEGMRREIEAFKKGRA